jgi:hypothetical protein
VAVLDRAHRGSAGRRFRVSCSGGRVEPERYRRPRRREGSHTLTISYIDARTSETLAEFASGGGDAIPNIGDDVAWESPGGEARLLRVVARHFVLHEAAPAELRIMLDSPTEVGRL